MSVIFSRAPLRVPLGGGGTDLASYYEEHGGFLVSGAIDKYIYMLTHTVFQQRYRLKYSALRRRSTTIEGHQAPDPARDDDVRHWRGNPLEIASLADVPAGTGHGVLERAPTPSAVLKALALRAQAPGHRRRPALAEDACTDRDRHPAASRSASRTSTPPRTAGSAPTTFASRTATVHRRPRSSSTADTMRRRSDDQLPALLHRRRARSAVEGRCPTRTTRTQSQATRRCSPTFDRHQADGPPRAATLLESPVTCETLRGAHARALGEQEGKRSPGMSSPRASTSSTRSRGARARLAASS